MSAVFLLHGLAAFAVPRLWPAMGCLRLPAALGCCSLCRGALAGDADTSTLSTSQRPPALECRDVAWWNGRIWSGVGGWPGRDCCEMLSPIPSSLEGSLSSCAIVAIASLPLCALLIVPACAMLQTFERAGLAAAVWSFNMSMHLSLARLGWPCTGAASDHLLSCNNPTH